MLLSIVPVNALEISENNDITSETSTQESIINNEDIENIETATDNNATENQSQVIDSDVCSEETYLDLEKTSEKEITKTDNTIKDTDMATEEPTPDDDNTISIDGWDLSLVFYDSSVNNGGTPLTTIDWNAIKENEQRVITAQINYKNTKAITTYAPQDLNIKIPDLKYKFRGEDINLGIDVEVAAGPGELYDWNYDFEWDTSTHTFCYIFTNNNTIEENTNCEGSIQITYLLKPDEGINPNAIALKAIMNDKLETNEVTFDFRSSEKTYTLQTTPKKIQSMDGLPEGDYIWVKYNLDAYYDRSEESGVRRVYREDAYFQSTFQENCIVLDKDQNPITPQENGMYKIDNIILLNYSNYYKEAETSIFVGYPISQYDNALLEENFQYVGYYCDKWSTEITESNPKDERIVANSNCKINLDDFKFEYTGDLYYINKGHYVNDDYRNSNIIKNSYEEFKFFNEFNAIYTGKPITVRIGEDICYIKDDISQEYKKLTDNEYYFSRINIPILKNGNNVTIENNKYNMKLFVRYANTNNYVEFDSWKNTKNSKTITFNDKTNIVGYYIEIYDLAESTIISGSGTYLYSDIKVHKEDIGNKGRLYGFNYLQVYDKDGNLLNEPTLDNYNSTATQANIAEYDKSTYGTYMQRSYSSISYINLTIPIYASSSFLNYTNNSKNNCFYSSINIGMVYSGKTDMDDDDNFSNISSPTDEFKGYRLYNLLPKGVELTDDIFIDNYDTEDGLWKYITYNGKYFESKKEYIEYVKNHTTITTKENWRNTGRTWIEIKVDFTDCPLNTIETQKYEYTYDTLEIFNIPIKITYESFIEYGNTYKDNVYLMAIDDELTINKIPYTIKDNGEKDKDSIDIDENGSNEDKMFFNSCTLSILNAVSTHQGVTKTVQTDKSNFSTGTVKASPSSCYTYKLSVSTGASNSTNLIIYDSIEESYKDKEYWKGEFLGIDTSYAESKGYIVKPYYSENKEAGNLYNEDGSLNNEYKEYIDKNIYTYEYRETQTITSPNWPNKYNSNMTESKDYWEISSPGAVQLEITFDSTCHLEADEYDYLKFYDKNGNNITSSICNTSSDRISSNNMAGKTYIVNDDYVKITMASDSSVEYKGFSANITPKIITNTKYATDKSKVKSLAFEYLNKNDETKKATIPANSLTYVLIKMKAPSDNNIITYAYNSCRTEWNALDDYDRPVDFITGVNSNTVKVNLGDYRDLTVKKIWDDENNKYNLRPDNINIILKKNGVEVDKKTIEGCKTKPEDEQVVTFTNLLADDYKSYTIEEESIPTYEASIEYDEINDYYILTNKQQNMFKNITGTKSWIDNKETKRPESITVNLLRNGEHYKSTLTGKNNNWEYNFENVPVYDNEGIKYTYTIEELPIKNYETSYTKDSNGIELNFEKEDITYLDTTYAIDYTEVLYEQDGLIYALDLIYKLNEGNSEYLINGKKVESFSNIYIPTNKFWILKHMETNDKDYKKINIKVNNLTETPEPSDNFVYFGKKNDLFEIFLINAEEYKGNPHEIDVDMECIEEGYYAFDIMYYYVGKYQSSKPQENFYDIRNTYNGTDYINLNFTKKILDSTSDSEASQESFEKLKLNKDTDYKFKINIINQETGDIVTGTLNSNQGLKINNLPTGTYIIEETADNYFKFINMDVINNDIQGISFKKENGLYIFTVDESAPKNTDFQIIVTNKLKDNRFYEDKKEKENLFSSKEPIPIVYLVEWCDYNGNTLQQIVVQEGTVEPSYIGEPPTRPDDENYTYEFKEWVRMDDSTDDYIKYIATYTKIPISTS